MFRDPVALAWLVPALAAAAFLHWFGARRRGNVTAEFGRSETLSRLVPAETAARRKAKAVLKLAALLLVFVALAGPQWGVELVPTRSSARQVVIAVDTSLSMTTEDVKPSRLERAKEEMTLLLEGLKGDRVGIVAFAGEAAVVCPLTTDVEAAKLILRSLEPGMIPAPGTAIGKAIRLGVDALERYPGGRSLILLSDGEDHKTDPAGAAKQAAEAGVRIFSIGVGTSEGEPIPLRDPSGALLGYKKDRKGATVVSRLGEGTLTDVARTTSGAYFRSSPGGNEASEILQRLSNAEPGEAAVGSANRYRNHFELPLAAAFLLLLVELLIPERGPLLALFVLALAAAPGQAQAAMAEGALRRGNKLYDREQYLPALEEYSVAGRKAPRDSRPTFNAGDALYRLEQYDKAAEAFQAVAESNAPPALRADAYYNLGNLRFQSGDLNGAIAGYRKALALNPHDGQAWHNLAVALQQKRNPPSQRPQGGKDKKQQPPPKPEDKNKSGGAGTPPPAQPKTRPEDQISKEDAERILRAISEKEKALQKQLQLQKKPPEKPQTEEDW